MLWSNSHLKLLCSIEVVSNAPSGNSSVAVDDMVEFLALDSMRFIYAAGARSGTSIVSVGDRNSRLWRGK